MIHITKYLVSIKLHFVCFLIGFLLFMNIFYFYYFIPMQFQTAVEYQRFVDRWFKCCVRVALDSVSALNLCF